MAAVGEEETILAAGRGGRELDEDISKGTLGL